MLKQGKNLLLLITAGVFLLTACGTVAPSTPKVEKFTDIYAAGIAWMDHLKTCEPYTQSYTHPFLQVEQVNTIKGKEGDVCAMSMQATGKFTIDCKLNADGVKTMTSDALYAQMKSKTLSTDDATTAVTNSQCKLTMSTP